MREDNRQAAILPDSKPQEPGESSPPEGNWNLKRNRVAELRQSSKAKWALLAAFVAAAIVGVAVWRYYLVRESTDDAQADAYITPVSARVGGTALAVNFDDNQVVHKGQVLVRLDPKDYQVALEKARADLADAVSSAAAARSGVPITSTSTTSALADTQANLAAAEREVSAAQAREREAAANYTKAALDLQRMKDLVAKDEIPRQQYDNAVAAEQAAQAALDAARSTVAVAQSHVAQAQAQVQSAQTAPQQVSVSKARASAAEAAVEQKRAAVAQAELNLQYTTVQAPVTGIAGTRNVQPGQVVQAGQPLLSLVNLEDIWVTASYKETQLKNMRLRQPAIIHVDAYDADYKGHVDSIGGATGARYSLLPPENATGNYVKVVQRIPVKIVFEPGQAVERLRPGMSVVVTVLTK